MALRVLLADESSTIKKVFQLALQDYAVEVKSVNVGVDVLHVCQKYSPDIVFADVLLQKQSGYEVCSELKANNELKHIPVVLMWSGFMELDGDKFDAAGANGRLEKPFDVKTLRDLINHLVPKTQTQQLSKFLQFPKMPEFEETPPKNKNIGSEPPPLEFTPSQSPDSQTGSNWSMDDFSTPEEIENKKSSVVDTGLTEFEETGFEQVNLSSKSPSNLESAKSKGDEDLLLDSPDDQGSPWIQEDLTRFRVDLDDVSNIEDEPEIKIPDLDSTLEASEEFSSPSHKMLDQVSSRIKEPKVTQAASTKTPIPNNIQDNLDDSDLELELEESTESDLNRFPFDQDELNQLIQRNIEIQLGDQTRKIIEDVVWKILPDLAERIVERELKKLLEQFEPQQYT